MNHGCKRTCGTLFAECTIMENDPWGNVCIVTPCGCSSIRDGCLTNRRAIYMLKELIHILEKFQRDSIFINPKTREWETGLETKDITPPEKEK